MDNTVDSVHAGAGNIVDAHCYINDFWKYVDSNWSISDGNSTSSTSCMGILYRTSWNYADNVCHLATDQIKSVDHHATLERSGSTADAAESSW